MHGLLDWNNPVNTSAPLNSGLVSWWLVGEDNPYYGHPLFFDLISSYHGTLTSGPLWTGIKAPGRFGSIYQDGADDLINFGNIAALDTYPTSVFLWCKIPATPPEFNKYARIFAKYTNISNAWGIIYEQNTGDLAFEFITAGAHYCCFEGSGDSSAKINTDVWAHVGFCVDASGLRGYKDGVQVFSNTWTGTPQRINNAASVICGLTATIKLQGYFDDARIYNRSLSGKEVYDLYEAGRAGYPDELNWFSDVRGVAQEAAASKLLLRLQTEGLFASSGGMAA